MALSATIKAILNPIPAALRARHLPADLSVVRQSVQANYHRGWRAKDRQTESEYARDLEDHTHRRLELDRAVAVPWLNAIRPLAGAKILEIGCGTGSSSVALAEQGAELTGIDIDDDALIVARDRAKAYGVSCEFRSVNVADVVLDKPYDFVIFFACLEHMTIAERLVTLSSLWQQMARGSHLAVVETPNRLWYYDGHTSWLPFFDWLPDELAFHYTQRSPRKELAETCRELTPVSMERFRRHGRGASFHEFDVSIGDARTLNVVSSLGKFRRLNHIGRPRDWAFKALLKRIYPGLHPGWFDPTLDLVIRR